MHNSKNKLENTKIIKALVYDLVRKGISTIANLLEMTFNTIKSYYGLFKNKFIYSFLLTKYTIFLLLIGIITSSTITLSCIINATTNSR